METARRLGAFFLVLAFVLYTLFSLADPAEETLRGQLMVYTVIFGGLGLLLVIRYRSRGSRRSSRFSWIRNFLFKTRSGKRGKDKRRGGRRDRNNQGAIGDPETDN